MEQLERAEPEDGRLRRQPEKCHKEGGQQEEEREEGDVQRVHDGAGGVVEDERMGDVRFGSRLESESSVKINGKFRTSSTVKG